MWSSCQGISATDVQHLVHVLNSLITNSACVKCLRQETYSHYVLVNARSSFCSWMITDLTTFSGWSVYCVTQRYYHCRGLSIRSKTTSLENANTRPGVCKWRCIQNCAQTHVTHTSNDFLKSAWHSDLWCERPQLFPDASALTTVDKSYASTWPMAIWNEAMDCITTAACE